MALVAVSYPPELLPQWKKLNHCDTKITGSHLPLVTEQVINCFALCVLAILLFRSSRGSGAFLGFLLSSSTSYNHFTYSHRLLSVTIFPLLHRAVNLENTLTIFLFFPFHKYVCIYHYFYSCLYFPLILVRPQWFKNLSRFWACGFFGNCKRLLTCSSSSCCILVFPS